MKDAIGINYYPLLILLRVTPADLALSAVIRTINIGQFFEKNNIFCNPNLS